MIGCVTIGERCYVGARAVLRGDWVDIAIGRGCNTQENCVVNVGPDQVTEMGPSCHVGHGVVIYGATLGRNAIAGMHAVIHDGVRIRAGCVMLWNNTVAGASGKTLGDVSEEQRTAWDWGLKSYQGLSSRGKESLRRL